MGRRRKWDKDQFIQAVKESDSIAGVLRGIGLEDKNAGSNYLTVKRYVEEWNLDTAHWTGQAHNKGKTWNREKTYTTEEILVENSPYCVSATSNLKKRLIKEGVLKNICSECGQKPFWKKKALILVLDHISGIKKDNRIENLRILCPNCNSQQPTFAGRNQKMWEKKKYFCKNCDKQLYSKGKTGLCVGCAQRKRYGNIERPNIEQLRKDVRELGYLGTGRKYGVSDTAIRSWIK